MVTSSIPPTRVLDELKAVFGHSSFRPLQAEIVRSILDGRDVFVLMPTGGGKSLCYQLPAVLRPGVTVVVSPLIALMKDQVDAVRALGVEATYINSSLDPAEIARRERALVRGELRLVYVAPERLMMPSFLRLLSEVTIESFAVDEAHCISEWGHDFRPEYRELRRLRTLFPDVSIGAFTATATERVEADIKAQLRLEGADSYRGSFNRPNLFYDVRDKRGAYEDLVSYLRNRPDASGIIYCLSRAGTEDLAQRLRRDGFDAAAYHAGLSPEERRTRQERFIRDDVRIMVATVAFGMGIDKPDVRFVVHYDLPKTLEGYYQESGRAGRDGEPSDCILYFDPGDVMKHQSFLTEKSPEEKQVAIWQLRQMADWAGSPSCRRRTLLAYFGEDIESGGERCCDVCLNPVSEEDYTVAAQMFLSCVMRVRERFGAGHVIAVLRGSRNQKVLSFGHDRLSTYGIGSAQSEDEWRHIARELARLGYVYQDPDAHNTLTVTPRGKAVLFDRQPVSLPVYRPRIEAAAASDTPNPALFSRLRALRKQLADDAGVPPYVIFHDSVLKHMAARLPTTREGLRRTPGVGERKASSYGPAFLEEIARFVGETGASAVEMPATQPTKPAIGQTVRETVALFQQGLGLDDIARLRDLTLRTVEGHLAGAIEAGEEVDLDRLVSPARRAAIERVMNEVGWDYLAPAMERLGPGYSYGELQFVRAYQRAGARQSAEAG